MDCCGTRYPAIFVSLQSRVEGCIFWRLLIDFELLMGFTMQLLHTLLQAAEHDIAIVLPSWCPNRSQTATLDGLAPAGLEVTLIRGACNDGSNGQLHDLQVGPPSVITKVLGTTIPPSRYDRPSTRLLDAHAQGDAYPKPSRNSGTNRKPLSHTICPRTRNLCPAASPPAQATRQVLFLATAPFTRLRRCIPYGIARVTNVC